MSNSTTRAFRALAIGGLQARVREFELALDKYEFVVQYRNVLKASATRASVEGHDDEHFYHSRHEDMEIRARQKYTELVTSMIPLNDHFKTYGNHWPLLRLYFGSQVNRLNIISAYFRTGIQFELERKHIDMNVYKTPTKPRTGLLGFIYRLFSCCSKPQQIRPAVTPNNRIKNDLSNPTQSNLRI